MHSFLLKRLFFALASLICFLTAVVPAVGQTPVYRYLTDADLTHTDRLNLTGPARIIAHQGRQGLNLTGIRSTLELKAHNLKGERGTVTLWVMPLEELSSFDTKPNFSRSNPHFYTYPLLSDSPNSLDFNRAGFKLAWTPAGTRA